ECSSNYVNPSNTLSILYSLCPPVIHTCLLRQREETQLCKRPVSLSLSVCVCVCVCVWCVQAYLSPGEVWLGGVAYGGDPQLQGAHRWLQVTQFGLRSRVQGQLQTHTTTHTHTHHYPTQAFSHQPTCALCGVGGGGFRGGNFGGGVCGWGVWCVWCVVGWCGW